MTPALVPLVCALALNCARIAPPRPALWPQDAIPAGDLQLLARLVVAECRSFGEPEYSDCALGVIDTVFERIGQDTMTDGTVRGTLARHSGDVWQFPPSVTVDCEYLPDQRACLDGLPLDRAYAAVLAYQGGARGPAEGFLFYQSLRRHCGGYSVQDDAGWFVCFSNN